MILLITGMLLKVREREILLIFTTNKYRTYKSLCKCWIQNLKRWSSKII